MARKAIGRPRESKAALKARGALKDAADARRRRSGRKVASKSPARRKAKARVLSEAEILAGIPGYDPRLHAGDRYVYRHALARKAIRFFHDRLTLAEGSEPGTPFILQPWQQAVVGNLFGWVDRATGRRRYWYALIYVAKKNGKTEFSAGTMLYVLHEEARRGIRCFSLASSRDQTNNVFNPAATMIAQDDALRGRFTVFGASEGAQKKSIVSNENRLSTFRGLPHDADTSDGVNPHLVIGDELHRWKSGDLLGIMLKGMVSRALNGEPFALLTTTADSNRPSVCNQWVKRARAVRDNRGRLDDPGYEPRVLPVLYEADPKDDWRSPTTWRKANPSLGVTVSEEALAEEVRSIRHEPSLLNDFLRFHLNIVTDVKEAAIPLHDWDACPSEPPSAAVLARAAAYGGFDLSHTVDLTSLALWWPSLSYARWWFWIPRERALLAEDRDQVPYSTWAREGLVELVEGNVIDQRWIEDRILQITSPLKVTDIGYDPWNCRGLAIALQSKGVAMVEMRQGHQTLGGASKALEAVVVSHKLNHGGNPVARWNAGNLAWRRDANGNIAPEKGERPNLRIDGMVALIMAIARATAQPAPRRSSYEGRRMLV